MSLPLEPDPRLDRLAVLVSRLLTESADTNAAVMTMLDLQARILARLESRSEDSVVDEVSDMLKSRRRELLRELDAWSDLLSEDDPSRRS
jgi:hypothetical protein